MFPDIPVSNLEEARGARPHSEKPCFHLVARVEGSFRGLVGKEFLTLPSLLKRSHSPQERREELQRRATIPRVPQNSQSIPEEPVFPALPRLSRRGTTPPRWHVGQPCGKASWERHRSLEPRDRNRDIAATAREESARACPHSRRGLTPLGRLQKYPKIHVSTGEESSGSSHNSTQCLRPRYRR